MTNHVPDSLDDLLDHGEFIPRHIGSTPVETATMLAAIGFDTMEAMVDAAVPGSIRLTEPMDVGPSSREVDVLSSLRSIAAKNQVVTTLLGMGYTNTIMPAVLRRNLLENPGWYTAYTPYQPEISQGRLEALLNFQTLVGDLTGLPVANSSMLDEPTAAAEAMTLLKRVNKKNKGAVFFVDESCHPQTIAVLQTRATPIDIEVVVGDPSGEMPEGTFAMLLAQFGSATGIRDIGPIATAAHDAAILVAVTTDLLGLTLVESPGSAGADVAVGSAQRFGVSLGYGGPHAGFMATREDYKRSLPGRIVGQSVDAHGRPALRLALQTREQHIRREKATSNICTAQVLLAVIASMYAVYHGPDGLRSIATRVNKLAGTFAHACRTHDLTVVSDHFFDTVAVTSPGNADSLVGAALGAGYNIRRIDADTVGVTFDETSTAATVDDLLHAFALDVDIADAFAAANPSIPDPLARTSQFCTAGVFQRHRSETQMLRYLRRLVNRDIALDRSMIPLGSCTMKLNAAVEMEAITWPEFADIHPFAPASQTAGYQELIDGLSADLVEITGYDAVSLQPNAGSQGELAGLLAISAYHQARGENERTICLIPASAHGTNAASAVMAGMKVVVVNTGADGNIDMNHLAELADQHAEHLGAAMVTYPSTHGVFEDTITTVCDIIHNAGGQVYVDGANLNALVGLAKPGHFGGDVSHLNLHKTFCIPHGGGGPGVGPVVCGSHLAPFLPGHPLAVDRLGSSERTVAAAPYGSAGILPISWAYVRLMGSDGLREATEMAILQANYIANRLEKHYPVLYRGPGNLVAHECIIDLRDLKDASGVTVDDVAKRLIDFGFHAPTMSFPVAGTLMIEPTESESLAELDRFCEALICIRGEIAAIQAGEMDLDDSPLRNAPLTAAEATADQWDHGYSRSEAAWPAGISHMDRYWPPVSRIDGAHGDKNLICACTPLDDYR